MRPHHGDARALAIWLFGLGAATNLFTGRLTFALGLAIGVGALLALDRDRRVVAGILAPLTACASPVAGLFLAFAEASAVTGRRRDGLLVGGLPPQPPVSWRSRSPPAGSSRSSGSPSR